MRSFGYVVFIVFYVLCQYVPLDAVEQDYSLEANLHNLDEYIEQVRNDWKVPGVGLVIVKDNKILHLKGYGFRDIENRKPVTADSVFSIASCTKAFTGTMLVMLDLGDVLDLEKPVIKYYPALKIKDACIGKNITLLDMMTHRTGYPGHNYAIKNVTWTLETLIDKLRHLEPFAGLREKYSYNNMMVKIAGTLGAKLNHSTWEDSIKDLILKPLEMNSTYFTINEVKRTGNYAQPYTIRDGKTVLMKFERLGSPAGPSGGIKSTLNDLSKWLIFNLGGSNLGDLHIKESEILMKVFKPRYIVNSDESSITAYGLGWKILYYDNQKIYIHGGSLPGFSTKFLLFPKQKLGVALLINQDRTKTMPILVDRIWSYIHKQKPENFNKILLDKNRRTKKKKIVLPNEIEIENCDKYIGTYSNPGYGTISVIENNKSLHLLFNKMNLKLVPNMEGNFYFKLDRFDFKFRVEFKGKKEGKKQAVSINFEPQLKPIQFIRVN